MNTAGFFLMWVLSVTPATLDNGNIKPMGMPGLTAPVVSGSAGPYANEAACKKAGDALKAAIEAGSAKKPGVIALTCTSSS